MRYETIDEAAHAWVGQFNAVPTAVIEKLATIDIDGINEITPPAVGDRVTVASNGWREGEIERSFVEDGSTMYSVKMDDGDVVSADIYDIEMQHDGFLPMWGMMWAFDDAMDNYWLEQPENLQKMADCGFRIYEQEDYDYVFGIDGAGYDFYEEHWIPLYKAVGLKWHAKE